VAVNPSTLALGAGTMGITDVTLSRPMFNFDDLDLAAQWPDGGAYEGFTVFTSNGSYFTDTALTLSAPFPWDGGAVTLQIVASQAGGGPEVARTSLQLVPRQVSTLLIDDDGVGTNQGNGLALSPEDAIFDSILRARGTAFDRFVMPYSTDGGELLDGVLNRYTNVIWYTGDTWSPLFCFLPENEAQLARWLDLGGKHLLFDSDSYFYAVGESSWTSVSNAFVEQYLGGVGTQYLDATAQYMLAGVSGQPTAGLTVRYGTSDDYLDYLNPGPGTDTLMTESGKAVATRHLTDGGSTVVFAGFDFVEFSGFDAGGVRRSTLNALLDATGIP
jgi:hypothetical protein